MCTRQGQGHQTAISTPPEGPQGAVLAQCGQKKQSPGSGNACVSQAGVHESQRQDRQSRGETCCAHLVNHDAHLSTSNTRFLRSI